MNPSTIQCDLSSSRAAKARFARILDSKPLRYLLWLVILSALCIWGWLVFVEHQPVAHLLLAVAGSLSVLVLWYYGELKELAAVQPTATVTDMSQVLDRRLLARIKPNMTPQDIARIVSTEQGGYFFAARFAIGKEFLQNMLPTTVDVTPLVWQQALAIAEKTGSQQVDSAVVAAALILTIPDHDMVLAQLQLDSNDIVAGVGWWQHMRQMIERQRENRQTGGIGRDLSFGWAPLLNHVGFNLTASIQNGGILRRPVDSRIATLDQMMHLLAQPGKRNVALVGQVGVGKTTLVYSLAQKMLQDPKAVPAPLRYQQVIELDAAHLIANAKGRGQLEELLIRIFNEAAAAKNVLIFLDEAQLFLRDGTGSVDLSNILLPVLEGGGIKLVLALDDQEWLKLTQTNGGLVQSLNRVVVNPLNFEETVQVIEDQTLIIEGKHQVTLMHQAIKTAYQLAERYIHEQAFPGKAIKLLDTAAGFPEDKFFVTSKSVQQSIEKSFDIKVQTADTAEEKDTLINLEERIHQRMINQTRAVKLVSDALRRARTGVRNDQKPIGTFLFLGPTGVGKTELSKALADVYFGGEDRIVRIDLNEFSHADDTNRLLAVGATDPYSLCAQIAKQPFSVVLLDEIEKAHPNVLNLLLQMLDEGTLRDAQNKPISFRDSIIITTSNAGADKIRAHIDQGQQLEQFEEAFVNELIDDNIFRPEFLNRFDEIVLFRPLTKEELMQVVDLLLKGLNKTLAARKISVTLTDAAKALLVEKGYDPRLGARPLRRVVQRSVENVVAQKLLAGAMPGQAIQLDAPELAQSLDERR